MPMLSAAEVVWASFLDAVTPREIRSPARWAEERRILARGESHRAGPWRNEFAPYLVEIMDALSRAPEWEWAKIVCVKKPAQSAGTEGLLNWIGTIIEDDPGRMLITYPTVSYARRFSRLRLSPMIASVPELRERVARARSRDSGNTTLMKEFDGGALILTGANAPQELAGEPLGLAALDDADRAPGEVGEEGDPWKLILARMTTFPNRKALAQSTPTIEGESRIENIYEASDQRKFMVPCPRCGVFDFLTWSGFGNFKDNEDPGHFEMIFDRELGDPALVSKTARMRCGQKECRAEIPETDKSWMVSRGYWQPTAQGDGQTAGYHWNAMYSLLGPSWEELVLDFLKAKNDPAALREWLNLRLAETYRRDHIAIKPKKLLERAEEWNAEIPDGVGALVLSCDVQDTYLAYMLLGFGIGEECWILQYGELEGDVSKGKVWRGLDKIRTGSWSHATGRSLGIERTVVDSGGHYTDEVYEYCKARTGEKVVAIRGGNDPTAELVSKSSRKNKGGVRLWTLGVDNGKDTLHSRLKIETDGPGKIHIPKPDQKRGLWLWANAEFAAGLLSEVSKPKRGRRGTSREWKPIRDRNEPWDCLVYGLSGLRMCGAALVRELPARIKLLKTPLREDGGPDSSPAPPANASSRPRRKNWVRSW